MTRAAAGLVFALLATGCAPVIVVDTPEPARFPESRRAGPPVAIEYVRTSFNGAARDVEDELLLLVANELRKSGLFSTVYEAEVVDEAPRDVQRLWLEVAQVEELENTGIGMLKALVTIYSLGLLDFLVPQHYRYEVELVATFHTADGRERATRSRAAGEASGSSLFVDWGRAGEDTRSLVRDRAFARLVDELARRAATPR